MTALRFLQDGTDEENDVIVKADLGGILDVPDKGNSCHLYLIDHFV